MSDNIHLQLLDFLGYVNVEKPVMGSSFLFKISVLDEVHEAILFVHPYMEPFVTVDSPELDRALVLKLIWTQYKLEDFLNYKTEDKNEGTD